MDRYAATGLTAVRHNRFRQRSDLVQRERGALEEQTDSAREDVAFGAEGGRGAFALGTRFDGDWESRGHADDVLAVCVYGRWVLGSLLDRVAKGLRDGYIRIVGERGERAEAGSTTVNAEIGGGGVDVGRDGGEVSEGDRTLHFLYQSDSPLGLGDRMEEGLR